MPDRPAVPPSEETAYEFPTHALRRLLDAYYGDKPESVEVAVAAEKLERWLERGAVQ